MKKFKKIIVATALAATMCIPAALSGCSLLEAEAGKDGADGKDFNIYEVMAIINAEREQAGLEKFETVSEFAEYYFSYSGEELNKLTSLQAAMNKSLLSGVSIMSTFNENDIFGTYSESAYAGAGVVLSIDKTAGDMTVVTNCHVVYDTNAAGDKFCDNIKLWFYGSEYISSLAMDAKIIGASKTYDIAVIQVSGSEVVKSSEAIPAEWATSESVYVGETVYAVGNPNGDGMSATRGVISKDSEYVPLDMDETPTTNDDIEYRVMRTDAAINGGNSGGGLYNADGKLIGIVNSKSVEAEVENMGYVLPASTSRRVVNSILENYNGVEAHSIKKAVLGITTQVTDTDVSLDSKTGLVNIKETVTVAAVSLGYPAYGKIKEGDIIKAIRVEDKVGKTVEDMTVLRQYNISDALLSVRDGYRVTVKLTRGGTEVNETMLFLKTDLTDCV